MQEWLIPVIGIGIGVGGLLTPIVIAARARDRALFDMIAGAKDAASKLVEAQVNPIHERIGRIRDEYLRRDDFFGHMVRMEKTVDDLRQEVQRGQEQTDKKLDDIRNLLQRGNGRLSGSGS